MGVVDVIVLGIFLFCAYLGYQRGIIKQLSDFIILFIASFLAGRISNILFGILYKFLPFFNFSGKSEGIKSINIIFWKLILYLFMIVLLIFIIKKIMLKLKLESKVINSMVEANLFSKIFGILSSIPLTMTLVFNIILIMLSPNFNMTSINDSKFASLIMNKTPILSRENDKLYDNQKYIIKRINKNDNTLENYEQVNNDIIKNILDTKLVSKEKISNMKNKLLGSRKVNIKEDNDSVNTSNDLDSSNESNSNQNSSENTDVQDDSSNNEIDNSNISNDDNAKESKVIIEQEESYDVTDSDDAIEETEGDYCEEFPGDC